MTSMKQVHIRDSKWVSALCKEMNYKYYQEKKLNLPTDTEETPPYTKNITRKQEIMFIFEDLTLSVV